MAIGEAHIFEVVVLAARADAFLATGGAFVIALFEAEEDVLELIHPRVGEKQRGIVGGDERRAAHDAVAALFEKSQECFADFVAGQIRLKFAGRLKLLGSLYLQSPGSRVRGGEENFTAVRVSDVGSQWQIKVRLV
jgi:hypothetical protein